jgi:K+/H+ antiporter YhaU regulatory subunit KhtT
MVADGLDVFRSPAPRRLAKRTLAESGIREKTGCLVLAIESNGDIKVNPPPNAVISEGDELILIGTTEAEREFLAEFRAEKQR